MKKEPTQNKKKNQQQQTFQADEARRGGWKRLSQCLVTHRIKERQSHTHPEEEDRPSQTSRKMISHPYHMCYRCLLLLLLFQNFISILYIFRDFFSRTMLLLIQTDKRRLERRITRNQCLKKRHDTEQQQQRQHTQQQFREKVFIGALSARRLDYQEGRRQHEKRTNVK